MLSDKDEGPFSPKNVIGRSMEAMAEANPIPAIEKAFGSKDAVGPEATVSFTESNSLVAKFAFLVLVMVIFIYLMKYGTYLIAYFSQPKQSEYIIQGLIPGNNGVVISQDPSKLNAVTIRRSNNEKTGIEYTYAMWLYLTPNSATVTSAQPIFVKGGATGFVKSPTDVVDGVFSIGLSIVDNGPGVYIVKNNTLRVVMDTFDEEKPVQVLDVPNIPLNKWCHVAVRMENKYLDVYVNGIISKREILVAIPKQNYADVQVCPNGGFSGSLSDLMYHSRALSAMELQQIVVTGPSTIPSKSAGGSLSSRTGNGSYLSYLWYR